MARVSQPERASSRLLEPAPRVGPEQRGALWPPHAQRAERGEPPSFGQHTGSVAPLSPAEGL